MPILGVFVIGILFVMLVVSVIPVLTGTIAIAILGKQAKLDQPNTVLIGGIFYLIMALYFGMTLVAGNDVSGFGAVFYFLLGLVWPFPMGFVFLGMTNDGAQAWLLLAAAFATTQLIAVIMILRRAKQSVEADTEL